MKRNTNVRMKLKGVTGFCLLFLFIFLFVSQTLLAVSPSPKPRPKGEKIVLKHADKVHFDQYKNPGVQIFIGNVAFDHNGLLLYCDSADFYQDDNSFKAFGHVRMVQGDTLSLRGEYLFYDGNSQIAQVRRNVVLRHRKTELYTDSLNYDRVYNMGYFFEGGKLVDGENVLTSDWGQYDTSTREALFNYNVNLEGKDYMLSGDTLYYDTRTRQSHMLGPSTIVNGESRIRTENGYFNSETSSVKLLDRSVVVDKTHKIVGDTIDYDKGTGEARARGNVVLVDEANKNIMTSHYCYYNDSTGYAIAYDSAQIKNYSETDTLYMHADTFKIYTYNLRTDSAYRVAHAFAHVRSYRTDVQSVADSMIYNSLQHKLSLFGNPIIWNENRQILGEEIFAYFNDSNIDSIHVVNQALMAERLDSIHYNQVAGREMNFYFENGQLKENRVIGNVLVNYFAYDDDSLMIGMNHTETSLLRLFMENKQLSKIWTRESKGTFYPLLFVTDKEAYLSNFAWFDYMRPSSAADIFIWVPKAAGTELKRTERRVVPFQSLKGIKR